MTTKIRRKNGFIHRTLDYTSILNLNFKSRLFNNYRYMNDHYRISHYLNNETKGTIKI